MGRRNMNAKQRRRVFDMNMRLLDERFDDVPVTVGFDFALRNSGVVALRPDGDVFYEHVVSTAKADGPVHESLWAIRDEFEDVLRMTNPNMIAFEGVTVGRNLDVFRKLAMVFSAMLLCYSPTVGLAGIRQVPFFVEIGTGQIKKAVTGAGRGATKADVMDGVKARWGYDVRSTGYRKCDDLADAYASARVAQEAVRLAKAYAEAADGVDDLDRFLMDVDKGRADIDFDDRMVNVLFGVFDNNSGLKTISRNDTAAYDRLDKDLKRLR